MSAKPKSFYGPDDPSVLHLVVIVAIWLLVMFGLRSCVESQSPNTIDEASRVLRAPVED